MEMGLNIMAKQRKRAQPPPATPATRIISVADPYDYEGRGAKINVVASLRDDPLGRLHDRGQIDEAQYSAGRHWQGLYEALQIGALKAIDTTKEPVDGGSFPEVMSDKQDRAMKELRRLSPVLGMEGEALLRDVLGERLFMDVVAARRGMTGQRSVDYLSRRFRETLETLAQATGYATPTGLTFVGQVVCKSSSR